MCSLSQLLRARALSIIWKVEVAWPMGSHFVEWWGSLLRRWVRRTSPHFVACHFTLRQTIRLTLSTPNLDAIISLVVLYLLLRLDQKVFDQWGLWNRFFIHVGKLHVLPCLSWPYKEKVLTHTFEHKLALLVVLQGEYLEGRWRGELVYSF